jgi:starch phosphorylase
VSEYHEHRAQRVWPENPMIAITNGIHLRRWDQVHSEDDLWQAHQRNKQALLQTIKRKTGEVWDPNTLLVGWGRRVVEYKRPLALFHDLARFKRLATRIDMPIRVVMSGKAHEGDLEGAGYLRQLEELIEGELKGLVTYLSNYSVHIASHMVAGCDVWLNTPRVGYEACGTSGMKAALNGTLPMSTADGWVEEIDLFGIGWKLSDMYVTESCLDELEYNIAPLFYAKDHTSWLTMMKQARELIQNDYSATRMLRDYIEKLYFPTI